MENAEQTAWQVKPEIQRDYIYNYNYNYARKIRTEKNKPKHRDLLWIYRSISE
jgi:hypothetical protein